jgi:hypothetical protein
MEKVGTNFFRTQPPFFMSKVGGQEQFFLFLTMLKAPSMELGPQSMAKASFFAFHLLLSVPKVRGQTKINCSNFVHGDLNHA